MATITHRVPNVLQGQVYLACVLAPADRTQRAVPVVRELTDLAGRNTPVFRRVYAAAQALTRTAQAQKIVVFAPTSRQTACTRPGLLKLRQRAIPVRGM
jgi:hypothetical protein